MSSVSIDDGVTVLECDITKTYTLEKIKMCKPQIKLHDHLTSKFVASGLKVRKQVHETSISPSILIGQGNINET